MELKFDNFKVLVLNKETEHQHIYRIYRVKQGDYHRDVLFTSRDLVTGGKMKSILRNLGFEVKENRKELISKIRRLEVNVEL